MAGAAITNTNTNSNNDNPADDDAAGGGGLKFNKMFVMIPVMLAARKLDAEDPQVVQYLRIAYGSIQTLCVLVVVYTYIKASSMKEKNGNNVVYVPAPATPFADPSAKKKYTQTEYQAHVVSTARSLLGSTLFGVAMTVGLHYYKGMAMGLAIQTIMGPFNLFENPLVKALLLGRGFRPDDKIFDEKAAKDLADDDDVVDANGNTVPAHALGNSGGAGGAGAAKAIEVTKEVTFDTLLLDTWDLGHKADIPKFVSGITKSNCNDRTKESGWTPLMILSGLDASGTVDGIQKVIALGGNAAITDGEGWNALHWSAFHGSVKAAKELIQQDKSLLDVVDKEGKSSLDMAKAEGNDDVATFLEECKADDVPSSSEKEDGDEGLRKRK